MDEAARQRLRAWLQGVLGEPVAILSLERLSGGAIQENWALTIERNEGEKEELVLRRDSPATLGVSGSRILEYHVLRAAHRAGVAVAEPLAFCSDPAILDRPFLIMKRVPGIANPRRLIRDDALVPDRAALGRGLGAELARIHAIRPSGELRTLGAVPDDPAAARILGLRAALDRLSEPEPAIEWVLRRLERLRPPPAPVTLVHGDYRIGNIMVDRGAVSAVLDWEFASWGDPDEDLGWLCARCWRFGRIEREAGGVAERSDVVAGYEAVSGRRVDPARVRYWEVMAAIRWAIIALEQGERYLTEQRPGLEAALTGRMAPELVLEAMTGVRRLGRA